MSPDVLGEVLKYGGNSFILGCCFVLQLPVYLAAGLVTPTEERTSASVTAVLSV